MSWSWICQDSTCKAWLIFSRISFSFFFLILSHPFSFSFLILSHPFSFSFLVYLSHFSFSYSLIHPRHFLFNKIMKFCFNEAPSSWQQHLFWEMAGSFYLFYRILHNALYLYEIEFVQLLLWFKIFKMALFLWKNLFCLTFSELSILSLKLMIVLHNDELFHFSIIVAEISIDGFQRWF